MDKTIGPGLSNNAIIIFSDQTLSIVRGAKKQEQRKIWRLKVGAPRLTSCVVHVHWTKLVGPSRRTVENLGMMMSLLDKFLPPIVCACLLLLLLHAVLIAA